MFTVIIKRIEKNNDCGKSVDYELENNAKFNTSREAENYIFSKVKDLLQDYKTSNLKVSTIEKDDPSCLIRIEADTEDYDYTEITKYIIEENTFKVSLNIQDINNILECMEVAVGESDNYTSYAENFIKKCETAGIIFNYQFNDWRKFIGVKAIGVKVK
jgi:hypothetical protein